MQSHINGFLRCFKFVETSAKFKWKEGLFCFGCAKVVDDFETIDNICFDSVSVNHCLCLVYSICSGYLCGISRSRISLVGQHEIHNTLTLKNGFTAFSFEYWITSPIVGLRCNRKVEVFETWGKSK